MKAVVILSTSDFSSNNEQTVVEELAKVISKYVPRDKNNSLDILCLDEDSIAKALIAGALNRSKVNHIDDGILKLCHDITATIGDPVNFSNESTFKVEFIKRFLNDADLRQHNTEVLKYLISTGKLKPAHSKILDSYHLSNIPLYLREINDICKFF
jgi:hypothetical protein